MRMMDIILKLSKQPSNLINLDSYRTIYKTRSAIEVARNKKFNEARGLVAAARAKHNRDLLFKTEPGPKSSHSQPSDQD